VVGAILLSRTSNDRFGDFIPWLLLCAVIFFALQPYAPKISAIAQTGRLKLSYAVAAVVLLISSVYGGYFGAGYGFLFMALMGLLGIWSMNQSALLKNLAGGGIELSALLYFVLYDTIAWNYGLPAMVGCFLGGLLMARRAIHMPQRLLRSMVLAIGCALVVIAFVQRHLFT
jgi:uncharacterized membrane protein YfcA